MYILKSYLNTTRAGGRRQQKKKTSETKIVVLLKFVGKRSALYEVFFCLW